MEIERESENFKMILVELGESYEGEYDPEDPESVSLLRLDIIYKKEEDEGTIQNGSFCTCIPATTDIDGLKVFLKTVLDHAEDLLLRYGEDSMGTISRILGLYSWYDENSNFKMRAKEIG